MAKQIYLAGGCFWGTEKYFSLLPGVVTTQVGYANGLTENPTYEEVCHRNTGHAETVQVTYDPSISSLSFLLDQFYSVIDPTSINRQGNDVGTQYRTGIYYGNEADKPVIDASITALQERLAKPVAIEVVPLTHFYPAEEYHQRYLDKHPEGYCHIPRAKLEQARNVAAEEPRYAIPPLETLRQTLTPLQFEVTQHGATEPPFHNAYHNHFAPGIYVDITTGEPLFISADKFESGCGWPSFSKPISQGMLAALPDNSHGMERVEVRSKHGNAHLGHVFPDGPKERGGLRYCINSASLRFVPKEHMETEGYGELLTLVNNTKEYTDEKTFR